uniref:UspA domain-containing protein n=2 Tax=Ciona savignyi TaxID=51511 RepID=H2YBS9_CIOSA
MKVLIAVDNSEIAEKAFDWYFEKIHKPGNEIVVGHAAEVARIPSYVFLAGEMAYPAEEMKAEIEKLKKKRNALNHKYKTKMEKYTDTQYKLVFEVRDHSAGESIVKMAEEENCDVIITGSRGLGAVRRTILGSVSDYVLHHAKIPVLVCHK